MERSLQLHLEKHLPKQLRKWSLQEQKHLVERSLQLHLDLHMFLPAPAATTRARCSWTLRTTHICGPVVGSGTCIGRNGSGGMGMHLMRHTPYAHEGPDRHLAPAPAEEPAEESEPGPAPGDEFLFIEDALVVI